MGRGQVKKPKLYGGVHFPKFREKPKIKNLKNRERKKNLKKDDLRININYIIFCLLFRIKFIFLRRNNFVICNL